MKVVISIEKMGGSKRYVCQQTVRKIESQESKICWKLKVRMTFECCALTAARSRQRTEHETQQDLDRNHLAHLNVLMHMKCVWVYKHCTCVFLLHCIYLCLCFWNTYTGPPPARAVVCIGIDRYVRSCMGMHKISLVSTWPVRQLLKPDHSFSRTYPHE